MLTVKPALPPVHESDNTTATSHVRKVAVTTTEGHLRYAESLARTLTQTLASPMPADADGQELWREQMRGIAGELVAQVVAAEDGLMARN